MHGTETPLIFDRRLLRRRRARLAESFARHDFLHHEVASRLLERHADVRHALPRVLELGCHDGTITATLRAAGAHVVAAEPDAAFLHGISAPTVVLDDEFLPFASQVFNLIISNLHLHVVNDLPGILVQCRRALLPEGMFLASMLGGETLWQLRQCLYEAEQSVMGGVSPRVAPFVTLPTAAMLLQRAGFALPVVDHERIEVTYPDAFALMRDLRGMGFGNCLTARLRYPTRRAVFSMAAEFYARKFTDSSGGIAATFDVIYLHGWGDKTRV
ncbi:MAG: methyltransferase domain-containing protein [Alphaproteobacteria bacterium]